MDSAMQNVTLEGQAGRQQALGQRPSLECSTGEVRKTTDLENQIGTLDVLNGRLSHNLSRLKSKLEVVLQEAIPRNIGNGEAPTEKASPDSKLIQALRHHGQQYAGLNAMLEEIIERIQL